MSEKDSPSCQQFLRVETLYWQAQPECGKAAHYLWTSDLRGQLRLCRRHAKAVGLQNCKPIERVVSHAKP